LKNKSYYQTKLLKFYFQNTKQNYKTKFYSLYLPKRLTSLRAQLRVIAPKQHGYLRRCWSSGKPFATLCNAAFTHAGL